MRGTSGIAALCALLAGCGGEVSGDVRDGDGGVAEDAPMVVLDAGPADAGTPVVAFESPGDGARLVRVAIEDGSWVARVELVVRAEGVDHVEVRADDVSLATLRPPALGTFVSFAEDGVLALSAIGRDASGVERARDEITIEIAPPADTSCHAMLDALGLDWEPIASLRGVADPVRVQPVIAGVRYRARSQSMPTAMSMDCELAPRLVRLSELLASHGIDEVIHLGIYNYRCIGGGDPASGTCTPSQHAYARAIDLHAFGLAGSDEVYSTEDDFVITRRADTCPMMSSSEPDRVLKDIACALWSESIFEIVLTPNYNDAHRNHYHVDLTAGSMYLGASVGGVDPAVDGLGD